MSVEYLANKRWAHLPQLQLVRDSSGGGLEKLLLRGLAGHKPPTVTVLDQQQGSAEEQDSSELVVEKSERAFPSKVCFGVEAGAPRRASVLVGSDSDDDLPNNEASPGARRTKDLLRWRQDARLARNHRLSFKDRESQNHKAEVASKLKVRQAAAGMHVHTRVVIILRVRVIIVVIVVVVVVIDRVYHIGILYGIS